MQNALLSLQEGDGICPNRFNAQFGFEYFDGSRWLTQKPGSETIGILFGQEFAQVIEGHVSVVVGRDRTLKLNHSTLDCHDCFSEFQTHPSEHDRYPSQL
jgi:hypothetical protein